MISFSCVHKLLERLRNEKKDKTKTQMTQSFNQNETKIWRQNILNQFNRVSSSCLRSHFVISLSIDDYATDGEPGVVSLLCSFYREPLRSLIVKEVPLLCHFDIALV